MLGKGQYLLLGNGESSINFKDNWYPFRQDSTLLYYSGIDIPGIHILIDIDNDKDILFGNDLTIDDIIWTGPLPSLQDYADQAGLDEVRPIRELQNAINKDTAYLPPYRGEHVILLSDLLNKEIKDVPQGFSLRFVNEVIAQRNIKESIEIDQMKQAVDYSYQMHRAVMQHAKSGMRESDLVGIASDRACHNNVSFAYPAILTTRGEVLHNHAHHRVLDEGDMVLYDGGCESDLYYAGDITRTFPVSGRWSSLQKEMYTVVYHSYRKAVEALRPGVLFRDIHLLACRALVDGLKDVGFMKGDTEEAVARGAHTMFFQCGLGHMIGLDVHDMENLGEVHVGYSAEVKKSKEFGLKSLRLGRALKEGYAVTVEPGIYIVPSLIQLRKSQGKYFDFINYNFLEKHSGFGGIRIEDNFIVTATGSEMLKESIDLPVTADEVENFMAGS